MDGYAVARSMRQTDWGKHAVLIAVTGYATPVIEDRCARSGFDHYLRKPVNYAEFTEAMSQTTFFELKRNFAMLKCQRAMELTTFIRLELEMAWRFLDTSTLMRNPVDKERNRGNARKAYNEADKWFNKDIGMTVEERSEIAADLARLKPELFPSSRSCPTVVPRVCSRASFGPYDYVVRLRAFSRASQLSQSPTFSRSPASRQSPAL